MKRFCAALLLLAALAGFAVAEDEEDEGLGLSAGVETWKDADEEGDTGFAPFVEFERSVDALDIYFKAAYDVKFGHDTNNQALYLEEALAYNFEGIGPGMLSIAVDNFNLFGTKIKTPLSDEGEWNSVYYYNADEDVYSQDNKITGQLEPTLSYEAAGLGVTAGFTWLYLPGKLNSKYNDGVDASFKEFFGQVGYTHSTDIGDFGLEVKGIYTIDFGPDAKAEESGEEKDKSVKGFYEYDITLSYAMADRFGITLGAELVKDGNGKFLNDYNIIPGFEVYVDKLTLFGEVKFAHAKHFENNDGEDTSKTWTGFIVGAKYSF